LNNWKGNASDGKVAIIEINRPVSEFFEAGFLVRNIERWMRITVWWVWHWRMIAAHCRWSTAHWRMIVAHCRLIRAHCGWIVAHWRLCGLTLSMPAAHCALFVAHWCMICINLVVKLVFDAIKYQTIAPIYNRLLCISIIMIYANKNSVFL